MLNHYYPSTGPIQLAGTGPVLDQYIAPALAQHWPNTGAVPHASIGPIHSRCAAYVLGQCRLYRSDSIGPVLSCLLGILPSTGLPVIIWAIYSENENYFENYLKYFPKYLYLNTFVFKSIRIPQEHLYLNTNVAMYLTPCLEIVDIESDTASGHDTGSDTYSGHDNGSDTYSGHDASSDTVDRKQPY